VEIGSQEATYVYALSKVARISYEVLLRIREAFQEPQSLVNASRDEIMQALDARTADSLYKALYSGRWSYIWKEAEVVVQSHIDKDIIPVPITNPDYPVLLKLIPSPPKIIYLKGQMSALCHTDTVAIVGTRTPTEMGMDIARKISRNLAEAGYNVISGLAKGIDTAAHLGALDAGGTTIAVLGTAVDEVYPAENKSLAESIREGKGALISEFPMGQKTFRGQFVQRNRIQSGLSLAVIPVQSDIEGGTMHTVRFAEKHGRLLFCPQPVDTKQNARGNAGIIELIQSGRALSLQATDYLLPLNKLQEHKAYLLSIRQEETFAKKETQAECTKGTMKPRQIELPLNENNCD